LEWIALKNLYSETQFFPARCGDNGGDNDYDDDDDDYV